MKSLWHVNYTRPVYFCRTIRHYVAFNNSKIFYDASSINPRVLDERWRRSISNFQSLNTDVSLNKKYKISDDEVSRDFDELIFHMYADGKRMSVLKFIEELKIHGIVISKDPRFASVEAGLNNIIRDRDGQCDFETFRELIHPVISIIHNIFQGRNVITNFCEFTDGLTQLLNNVKDLQGGKNATHIPQLARADPNKFGLSICSVDGQRFSVGDYDVQVPIQQVVKPLMYGIALTDLGEDLVHKYIGHEPSGFGHDKLMLNKRGTPHNPMINAGALVLSSLIYPDHPLPERIGYMIEQINRLCGGGNILIDLPSFISERENADRNYALAYYLRENKCFANNVKLRDICDLYFQLCSSLVDCEKLSVIAASLANDGVCPVTGDRILKSIAVRDTLSMMNSCGLYKYSGQFAFKVGFPAKSSVSGFVMAVVPNVMGICTWSPPLDTRNNSLRGVRFMEKLVERFNFHNYDFSPDKYHMNPRIRRNSIEEHRIASMLFAVQHGSLGSMHRYLSSGYDFNASDYDGRTSLHIAAAEGALSIVKFLIEKCHVSPNPVDRWGRTPLKDAILFNREEVRKYLELI